MRVLKSKINLNRVKKNYPLWGLVLFGFLFLFCFPTNFLIIDELFYFRQGFTYASGNTLLSEINPITGKISEQLPGKYPLGLPLLIAGIIKLFGNQAVFLIGGLSLSGGIYFTYKALVALKLPGSFALIPLVYFPAVLLSRTLMSDVPSFLFIALFMYLIIADKEGSRYLFLAGLIAGWAFMIREPNVLLTFPFIAGMLVKGKRKEGLFILGGFILIVLLKLFLTAHIYGNPFFTKDPGLPFSYKYLFRNFVFYAPFLFIFIPLGLPALLMYKGRFHYELKIGVCLFLFLYLTYSYNGTYFSGLKSLILGPRFLIPALPLFTICVAAFLKDKEGLFRKAALFFAIPIIFGTQITGFYYNKEQRKIAKNLARESEKTRFYAEVFNLPKIYGTHSTDNTRLLPFNATFAEELILQDTFIYLETSFRNDNERSRMHSQKYNSEVYKFLDSHSYQEVLSAELPDKTVVKQFKVYN